MLRAIIFDFNGVIVDDEQVHFELFRDILGEEGMSLTEVAYHERFLGYDDRGCFSAALAEAGRSTAARLIDELIERKASRYAQVAEKGLRYFPCAKERLIEFSRLRPVAVCSGALRNEIEFALARLGVRSLVSAVVAAEDTSRCKPDPEGYLLTLERLREVPNSGLGSLASGECVAIEDSQAGIAAARAAGMVAIGVAHTYKAEELVDAGAHAVTESLEKLTMATLEYASSSIQG